MMEMLGKRDVKVSDTRDDDSSTTASPITPSPN